jgi:hypothetical protein
MAKKAIAIGKKNRIATKGNRSQDARPIAFVNMARRYYEAASVLVRAAKDAPPISTDPTYFLFLHAIELALKGYLRAHDVPILGTTWETHDLPKLYEKCQAMGLVVGPDDRVDISNIVNLLDSSNEFQGLRYFNIKSRVLPNLDWTSRTVGDLIGVVAAEVEKRFPGSSIPGPAVRANMTVTTTMPN